MPTHAEGAHTGGQAVCRFLRLETEGVLADPAGAPSDDHRCAAIDGPRVVSRQQQELMCLRSAHVDCPRYRRAAPPPPAASHRPMRAPALPRAIAASLVLLALSAGISFGFVLQRGGIDLPPSALPSGAAVVATASPSASGAATSAPSVAATPPPTVVPTVAPTPEITAPPTVAPTVQPTVTPEPTVAPTVSPAASGGPSASRLAVLKPCSGQTGCYLYAIRSGDNLFSIAHWFGVPLDTIYRWNPTLKATGIHAGMQIKIPTPTR